MVRFFLPSFMRRRVVPEAPETVFKVTLAASAGAFSGLWIAGTGGMDGMVVVDLGRSEAIKSWNRDNPLDALEIGHVILEVNGLRAAPDMLQVLSQMASEDVCMLVDRAATQKQRAVFERARWKFEVSHLVEQTLEDALADDCGEICPICHEDMDSGSAKLPCGHQFHKECVKKWLLRGNLRCPLCNSSVELPSEGRLKLDGIFGGVV